jgi:hypothetical protein
VTTRMNRNQGDYRSRGYRETDHGESPEEGKRSRSTLLIVAIIAVVVIVCLCVLCALAMVGVELYASGVLTATASAPTPTSVATDTPVPTNTPLPTATPTPAPAATPTPDPLGHLNSDEKGYLQGFEQQSQRWTEGRQQFDSLMSSPNPGDEAWVAEIVGELTVWKDLANQARGLPAPGRFQPAQDRYLEAVGHYDIAAGLAIEGINNEDVVAFDQAQEEISAGDAVMNEARDLVNSLKQP